MLDLSTIYKCLISKSTQIESVMTEGEFVRCFASKANSEFTITLPNKTSGYVLICTTAGFRLPK